MLSVTQSRQALVAWLLATMLMVGCSVSQVADDDDELSPAEELAIEQELFDETWAEAIALNDDVEFCEEVELLISFAHESDEPISKYPPHERVVHYVYVANQAIANGGFDFLFSADMPDDPGYELTAQAFETIECEPAATAFRDALTQFPRGTPPWDIDQRRALLRTFEETKFDVVNDLYFDAGTDGVMQSLAGYIRRHESAFKVSLSPRKQ